MVRVRAVTVALCYASLAEGLAQQQQVFAGACMTGLKGQ
jgi:hypothetical protein